MNINPAFEAILSAEQDVRIMSLIADSNTNGVPPRELHRRADAVASAKAHLAQLINALSIEDLQAFGQYRAAAFK